MWVAGPGTSPLLESWPVKGRTGQGIFYGGCQGGWGRAEVQQGSEPGSSTGLRGAAQVHPISALRFHKEGMCPDTAEENGFKKWNFF